MSTPGSSWAANRRHQVSPFLCYRSRNKKKKRKREAREKDRRARARQTKIDWIDCCWVRGGVGNVTTSHPFVLSNTNSLTAPKIAAGASTPVTSALYQVLLTPVPRHAPAVTTSPKPVHPSAYNLRPYPYLFTPKSSPATSYHEIKPSPYFQGHNHAPPNSGSVFQIAEALAKVTQLQRLPQAKPDVFTGNESDTKFFFWETAFDALIGFAPISAQQKMYLLYQHLDGNAKNVNEQL